MNKPTRLEDGRESIGAGRRNEPAPAAPARPAPKQRGDS